MSDLLGYMGAIILNLLIAIILASLLFKGYMIKGIESSVIALTIGGVASYVACTIFDPAASLTCATTGAVAALWASFATFYFHALK